VIPRLKRAELLQKFASSVVGEFVYDVELLVSYLTTRAQQFGSFANEFHTTPLFPLASPSVFAFTILTTTFSDAFA